MAFLLDGILPLACVFGAFTLLYVINVLFGILAGYLGGTEIFSWKRLIRAALKILLCAATMFVIVIAFNLIAYGLEQYDADIDKTIVDIISLSAFVLLFARGFTANAVDLYAKICELFDISDDAFFAALSVGVTDPKDGEAYLTGQDEKK